jgi:undecaprenyl-diphosphatase
VHVHFHPPLSPTAFFRQRRPLLIALGVAFALLAMSAAIASGQVLLLWDEPIQRGIESNRNGFLNELFLRLSFLGSTVFVLTAGALGTVLTWRRCPAVAVTLAVATLSRPLIEFTLKATVDRARPDFDRLVDGNGPSFPSGHPMAAVALWGLLPVVVSLYTQRRVIWWASTVVAFTLIAGIAASRVYLGVHWFSDVTAGLVVGTFFLMGVESLFHRAHGRMGCRLSSHADEPQPDDAPVRAREPAALALEPVRVRSGR